MSESNVMEKTNTPQLALCGDQRMAIPMAVTVRSLVSHARSRLDFHIIAADFSAEQREAIVQATDRKRGDTVEFLELDRRFDDLAGGVGGSRAYYFRLALPNLLQHLSHVLYLDSDLLVRGDITELWQRAKNSKAPLQACLDQTPFINAFFLPVFPEYGLTEKDPHYNSGVLGMNLDLCRSLHVSENIIAFLRQHGTTCPMWDQAAINALYSRTIDPLPEEWNICSSRANPAAKIIHYCHFKKPFSVPRRFFSLQSWNLAAWQKAMHRDPYCAEYFSFLDQTLHRGWRPRSLLTRVVGLAPAGLIQHWRELRLQRSLKQV